jgi:hypothetical protein
MGKDNRRVSGLGTITVPLIDVEDLYSELVEPGEFIRIFNEERESIARVEIVPPRLGESGFGKIRVVRKYSVPGVAWRSLIRNERKS